MKSFPQQQVAPLFKDVLEQHNQDKMIMSSLVGGTTKVDVPSNDSYGNTVNAISLHNQINEISNAQNLHLKGTKSFGGRGKNLQKNTWKILIAKLNRRFKVKSRIQRNKTQFRRKRVRAQSAVSRRLKR